MNRCYVCQSIITKENDSPEHILLKSLGDKQPVRGILCQQCNNWLGTTVDQPFINEFQDLYKTVSGKPEVVSMTSGPNNIYRVHVKNGQIENKPIIARDVYHQIDDKHWEAIFFNIDDANRFQQKKMERNNNKFKLSTEKTKSIPTFSISPNIDKPIFMLEILKMQTGYLHSIGYSKYTFGDIVFNTANKIKNEGSNSKNEFDIFSKSLIALFNSFIEPSINKYIPKGAQITHGISQIQVIKSQSGDLMFISLFGMLNLMFPIILPSDNM